MHIEVQQAEQQEGKEAKEIHTMMFFPLSLCHFFEQLAKQRKEKERELHNSTSADV